MRNRGEKSVKATFACMHAFQPDKWCEDIDGILYKGKKVPSNGCQGHVLSVLMSQSEVRNEI